MPEISELFKDELDQIEKRTGLKYVVPGRSEATFQSRIGETFTAQAIGRPVIFGISTRNTGRNSRYVNDVINIGLSQRPGANAFTSSRQKAGEVLPPQDGLEWRAVQYLSLQKTTQEQQEVYNGRTE